MINRTHALFVFILLAACSGPHKTTTSSTGGTQDQLSGVQRADVTYTFFNANKEKLLGNYNTAVDLFGEVIRKDPQNAAAMYELASVYMEQKKYVDALYFAKTSFKLSPNNIWYGRQYVEVLQRNDRFKEAAEVLEVLSKQYPSDEELYHQWAASCIFAGNLDDALEVYEKYESVFGIDEEISMDKCRIYQQQHKPEKAVVELKRLIAKDSSNVEVYGLLAEYYQTMGDTSRALETYQLIERMDPENAYVHLSLADFYRTAGDKERSVEELKRAFQNPKLEIETKISILGSYYSLVEQYPELKDQALALCSLLVKVHPNDSRSYAVMADFLVQEKDFEGAREQYRKAKALGSKEYSVHSQILMLDSQLRDWDAMLSESEEALSLFPDQPFVYYFNGMSKQQKKKYADAVTVLSSGVKMVVDNPELESSFYSLMGEAYHELKDNVKSDESFDKALALDPKDATVMNNYAYFLSMRGDKLAKAEALSKKSLELEPDQASYEDTYGWIMFMMGNYTDAKLWIGKAIGHTTGDNATLLEHYGDVLYKLGDTQQALEYWQRAKAAGDGGSDQLDQKILQKKYME